MYCGETSPATEMVLVDSEALAELKQASKDLRALAPESALADLVDAKIEAIEEDRSYR
jgi:hypothetical protein